MHVDGHLNNGDDEHGVTPAEVRTRQLRELIETGIPELRTQLESSHPNLEEVARYCESNYHGSTDKRAAFENTRRYALQSLASVAYQVNTLAHDMLAMLDLQAEKIGSLDSQVQSINMMVNINKEKQARREIGVLTTTRTVPKVPKIVAPAVIEPKNRYQRVPIDYSVLDSVGHGVRQRPTNNGHPMQSMAAPLVARSASSASGHSSSTYGHNYGAAQNYERLANINNTLSRSSMRSGMGSIGEYRVPGNPVNVDYRIPQVPEYRAAMSQMSGDYRVPAPLGGGHDGVRYSTSTATSGNGSGNYAIFTQQQQEYSDYGSTARDYGSQRSVDSRGTYVAGGSSGAVSPTLPLPPPSIMQQTSATHYRSPYETQGNRFSEAPREHLLDGEDDELPPPPPVGSQFFDVGVDVTAPVNYIERARIIYDYDAEKPDELNLRSNLIVYVLRKNEDGWFEGVLNGQTGLFPGNYVEPI